MTEVELPQGDVEDPLAPTMRGAQGSARRSDRRTVVTLPVRRMRGVVYALLAARLMTARRWADVLLTVMLSMQFIGRFFVFAAIDETWIRISVLPGALITLAVVLLIWRPAAPADETGSDPTAP